LNKQNQLTEIDHSGKPYIIYKSAKGFNLFTDFSKKIILNNKNIKSFLEKKKQSLEKKYGFIYRFFWL
jgi:para-aminobenzoate synthetase component 1